MQKSDVIVQSAIGAIVTTPRIFNIVVSCGTDLGCVVFRILGLWNEGGLAVSLSRFRAEFFECEDALSSDGMFATQLSSAAFPALCQVAALPQRYGSREPSQASYLLPPSQLTSLLERQQVQSALLNRLEFTLTKNYLFYENL